MDLRHTVEEPELDLEGCRPGLELAERRRRARPGELIQLIPRRHRGAGPDHDARAPHDRRARGGGPA